MNLLRLAFEIRIECTDNVALVLLLLTVQADEVLTVQRQDGPQVAARLRQILRIRNCLFCSARLANRQPMPLSDV